MRRQTKEFSQVLSDDERKPCKRERRTKEWGVNLTGKKRSGRKSCHREENYN
jgi:hypothetical protein